MLHRIYHCLLIINAHIITLMKSCWLVQPQSLPAYRGIIQEVEEEFVPWTRSGDAMAVSCRGRCKMNSLQWKILLKWMIKMDNLPNHPKLDHSSIETYCMVLEIHCRKPQCITVKCYMKHPFSWDTFWRVRMRA